jgi:hypothetical protein
MIALSIVVEQAMNLDRVRRNTSARVNRRIDLDMEQRVWEYAQADRELISQRIRELDREWDIDRVVQANAAIGTLTAITLGLKHDKRWFILPGIVLPFLLLHAAYGWAPPVPILRRMGVRTRPEIDREIYALKVLRGDFATADGLTSVEGALRAVRQ